MTRSFRIAGATLLVSILSSTAYAEPPHHGGLPPGLQKKLERGEPLPPGWSDRAGMYEYGYEELYYDQYGYEEPYYDQYEPEYVEDKVYRIIKDVRDLTDLFPQ
jgi:hypothetical protein